MSLGIRVASLTHRYADVTALHDVSISVPAGTLLAIVGESGSGKTTLLRALNRTIEPTPGCVFVDDVDVTTQDPVALRRRIGYVPQAGGLLPHWSVQRNVALVPMLSGQADPSLAATEALARCGLAPDVFAGRFPHELSGGQRQRVALARALAARQSLVLLDESFSALDAISRSELLEAFANIRKALGFTAVLVTHDLGEAARLADSIAVMRAGRVEQMDSLRALIDDPATPYVAQLVGQARMSARALVDA
ncbi:MAG TPA: ATP-binding cassette domain-containing protein [Gemmatimonas sp.]|nr:ATP-binding cassette domain-containing protein [Gemmatimonas sp.]